MTAQPSKQTDNNPMFKPISQLTRADIKYTYRYVLSEMASYLVFYGILFALCTTIGAMIWVGLWSAVLFVPIGAVARRYFKWHQQKKQQN